MGKFDGYLICTDLDGTFASGTEICGDNAKYVKYFQENGGLFTVITGRGPDHIKKFEDFMPNCPVITHQGAVLYDLEAEKVIYKNPLPDTFREIVAYLCGLKDDCVKAIYINGLQSTVNMAETECIDCNEPYFKVVAVAENPETASNLRKELGNRFGDGFNVFMGWCVGVECLAKDSNKGTAVEKLKELLGDKVKKVICVGDSESDAFMFRCADISYAVDNASAEAKEAADRITVHYLDGAIAQIIKDIESEAMHG